MIHDNNNDEDDNCDDIKNDNNDLKLLKARLGLDVQLLLDLVSHSGGILGHLAPIHLFHFTNDCHVLDVYDNTDLKGSYEFFTL